MNVNIIYVCHNFCDTIYLPIRLSYLPAVYIVCPLHIFSFLVSRVIVTALQELFFSCVSARRPTRPPSPSLGHPDASRPPGLACTALASSRTQCPLSPVPRWVLAVPLAPSSPRGGPALALPALHAAAHTRAHSRTLAHLGKRPWGVHKNSAGTVTPAHHAPLGPYAPNCAPGGRGPPSPRAECGVAQRGCKACWPCQL